jgi:hypothetical protein
MEMVAVEEDCKHFDFLANNSKEIFEKQVYSYRQQNVYQRIIIGFTLVYFPFFLVSLEGLNQMLHFISILQRVAFLGSILLLLCVFWSKTLDQDLLVSKNKKLHPKSRKPIVEFEFEANKVHYLKNNMITLKAIKTYLQSISLIPKPIIISFVMLLICTFLSIEKIK